MNQQRIAVLLACIFVQNIVHAFDSFVIEDIYVEGLQRISPGTVFNYLPVDIDDVFDNKQSGNAIRSLFKTGFFKDVRLERKRNILIVYVEERPSIDEIEITGNNDVPKDDLLDSLKDIGLEQGKVFNHSLLDKIEYDLRRLYYSQGKYNVKIETQVIPLKRNRINIELSIEEGDVAEIKQINLVGNNKYSTEKLTQYFKLSEPTAFSLFSSSGQYSKQLLNADMENLKSYYLDRGFINYKIDSTQVTITPDKKDVYININMKEGDRYYISEVKLSGILVVEKEELFKLVSINQGDVFSRKLVNRSIKKLTEKFSEHGYAFANINLIPKLDKKNKTVSITFSMDPGKRVYVNRINLFGNTKTRDEVLRREMRQMESSWMSAKKIERSRERLEKLGFFENVTVETEPVLGVNDQMNVNFSVEERASGNLMAGIGFSQSQGFLINASVTQDNFLGSGKKLGFTFNNSKINRNYRFSYTNPYYTIDGVSRGFNLVYSETDTGDVNISNYTRDVLGAGVSYSYPINEYDRLFLSFNYEQVKLKVGSLVSNEIDDFIQKNGANFDTLTMSSGWSHDTRNRAIFATDGSFYSISGDIALPGGELNYYKINLKYQKYFPLTKKIAIKFKSEFGFGNGYKDNDGLPFFENYFIGGGRSIRGFEDNSLGPKDSQNDPLGGNVRYLENLSLIFPMPFIKDSRSVRLSLYIDGGNVYDSNKETSNFGNHLDNFRYSTGVSATWLSPVGVLSFSFSKVLKSKKEDEKQLFQFSFGSAI
ncbi:MAG: outer membrane protein assembly factor BamA [Methylococcales bacterium]|nr:outer membrane protein assembly factor BamA [Methylococcales bacterium]MBT7409296.1 outer membrane protein assembly factor BamA [Methylococcales bacterium]